MQHSSTPPGCSVVRMRSSLKQFTPLPIRSIRQLKGVLIDYTFYFQVVLAIGVRSSRWKPTKMYPYGYGQVRYVTSLISGVGIFFIGCGLSVYHGIDGIVHPTPLEPLTYVRALSIKK